MANWQELMIKAGFNVPHGESQMLCPFHRDSHDSFSVNTVKGKWICYAGCGGGDLRYFFKKYLQMDDKSVDEYIGNAAYVVDINVLDDLIWKADPDDANREMSFDFNQSYVPDWIFDRGFTVDTLKRFSCGITAQNGLAVPILDKDEVNVGHLIRRVDGEQPKYVYATGFKKSRVLFGQPLLRDTGMVCITEGSLDTMWLDQMGYNSVALLGASISATQVQLLQDLPIGEIVLCLDSDEAGRIGTDRCLTKLSPTCRISYIELPEGNKDIQEISDKTLIDQIISNRNYW